MDLIGEECLKNVLPMLVDECTINGGVYGFPIDAQVKACFYNRKMFKEKGFDPIIHPYNFIHGVFHELDSFFTSMAVGTGNETVVEAMEMFSRFATYKDAGDTAVDQTQGIQNFAAGQRPMYMNSGWLMGDVIAANPEREYGMFPMLRFRPMMPTHSSRKSRVILTTIRSCPRVWYRIIPLSFPPLSVRNFRDLRCDCSGIYDCDLCCQYAGSQKSES